MVSTRQEGSLVPDMLVSGGTPVCKGVMLIVFNLEYIHRGTVLYKLWLRFQHSPWKLNINTCSSILINTACKTICKVLRALC
jgi:hypothetical protein